MPGQQDDLQKWLKSLKQQAGKPGGGAGAESSRTAPARQEAKPQSRYTEPYGGAKKKEEIMHQQKVRVAKTEATARAKAAPKHHQHKKAEAERQAEGRKRLENERKQNEENIRREQEKKRKQQALLKKKKFEEQKRKRLEEEKRKRELEYLKKQEARPGKMVREMINKPAALRQAFVFKEIFGPPAAFRKPGGGGIEL